MRLKGYLASRGVEFDAIDVAADPSAMSELKELGAKALPVVQKRNRYVLGSDLGQVDEFLGLTKGADAELPPEEIIRRLVRLVEAWARYARQLPPSAYYEATPGMEGVEKFVLPDGHVFKRPDGREYAPHATYYGLVGHVLRHARRVRHLLLDPNDPMFAVASAHSEYGEPLPEDPLADLLADGRDIVEHIRRFWIDTADRTFETVTNTHYGPKTRRHLLTREVYSLTQHTRQLMTALIVLGIEPDGPLGGADFEGINLPTDVWK